LNDDRGPWGFWVTIGLGMGVLSTYIGMQLAVLGGYWLIAEGASDFMELQRLSTTGLYFSLAVILSAPPVLAMIWFFTWLRRPYTTREYIGFRPAPVRAYLIWILAMIAVIGTSVTINVLLDRDTGEYMIKAYKTAGFVPLLWFAVVVGAPLFEEIFFRGFLFDGLRRSAGPVLAILITAASWAVIHLQYGGIELITIFAMGIVLGLARLKSGSIYPPLVMHALSNLAAMVELEIIT
jgi:membrane protease YdiL (CAAX protease family)